MVVCKKETEEVLEAGWRVPKVALAAEESDARQWNVTLRDSCQGVHWHTLSAKDTTTTGFKFLWSFTQSLISKNIHLRGFYVLSQHADADPE